MRILIQVWIDIVYSVSKTFTEDKVPTAAASYSLCIFFVYLQIDNLKTMKTYAFEDSWHLWEYFHNQSARCNLNSISSFHSSQVPNQNADQDHHCQ